MSVLTKCAACRQEKPVSEMEVCMRHQMHSYVCDAKCMHDFYHPPKKPASDYGNLRTANQRLEGENGQLKSVLASHAARRYVGDDEQRKMDDLVAAGIRMDQREIKRLEGEVARLREVLEDLLGCPANVVQATVPKAGIAAAPPYQVVLDVSVSLTRWKKAKAALSTANGEVT